MYSFFLSSALLVSLSFFGNGVHAQCKDACDTVGASILGNSTGVCGVDPSDAAYPAYVYSICPCSDQTLTQYQTATDASGKVVTATANAVVTASQTAYVTFTFSSLPYASISAGSPVTVELDASYSGTPQQYIGSYTYTPVTSIYYANTTSTITQYTEVATTTTSIMTVTETSTLAQATSTAKCATGTRTVIASPSIVHTTSIITPIPKTITKWKVTTARTTISCLGPQSVSKRDAGIELGNVLARQATITSQAFETPYCGTPTPTTYTTSTAQYTTNITTSDTITTVSTSTINTTIPANPATTTVCIAYQALTPTTPTLTSTRLSFAPRTTSTLTSTITLTQTILSSHIKLCSTKSINGHSASYSTLTPKKTTAGKTTGTVKVTSTTSKAVTTTSKPVTTTGKVSSTSAAARATVTVTVTITAKAQGGAQGGASPTVTVTATQTQTVTVTASARAHG